MQNLKIPLGPRKLSQSRYYYQKKVYTGGPLLFGVGGRKNWILSHHLAEWLDPEPAEGAESRARCRYRKRHA